MTVFDSESATPADQARMLRDVAQHRLRHTTAVGEALYYQATAKAAALAILAEFPTAAYLELEPSDQEGSNFSPGAILNAAGDVIAEDSFDPGVDPAERWDAIMDVHYGPLTDLPDEFSYDYETRHAVPPYPWLIATTTGDIERIDRLDVRAAAEIDLTDAIAAAFPEWTVEPTNAPSPASDSQASPSSAVSDVGPAGATPSSPELGW